MSKLRIIIGQGTAAEVYRYTGQQGEYDTIAIGPRGLWATLPGGHAMGQPPQLLALPGQKVPAFQQPSGKTSTGLKLFLDAQTYQQGLANLGGNKVGQRIEFASAKVTKVEPADYDLISVVVQDPLFQGKDLTLLADQVIFATGIGPQKSPTDAGIDVQGTPDNSLGFMQMEEGTDYLTHADRLGQVVVVYGGGATGAWVAAEVNDI